MADIRGVWGIDIGLSGLKAIRLVYAESAKQVLATAFDYVPHPKILSQPDANPDELIGQALETFLSRNNLAGDGVAISVPGQTALARFIQLPPVEASKVVEIVKYEARQQIPFALDEVIWDYQPLGAGTEESGFMLDAEVGLFAMKRDQVQQHLQPFLDRKVEVDLVQIAPLALYNFLCHDRFGHMPEKPSDDQEDYTLLLDMGADNTTLLVSNGKKIWIRNVPLGGNHFTRALTKDMKLTFAKAEHLKCNATKAPDPKAVFQALRPVFNDYVSEIQRSIGYFASVNRDAKIAKIVGVGNGFKLAGLQKFLQQNLQMEVERVDSFPALAGDAVLNAPLFQENLLSFAVPYGLALQGLKVTRVHTSLLPPEITMARLVRKKKPWALASAALLLLGLVGSAFGGAHVWSAVSKARFAEAEPAAEKTIANRDLQDKNYKKALDDNKKTRDEFEQLVAAANGKTDWLEVYKAINECLPRDCGNKLEEPDPTKRDRMRIFRISTRKEADLGKWFTKIQQIKAAKAYLTEYDQANPPSGEGYVFTLSGRHYHHDPVETDQQDVHYVRNTFLRNLQMWRVPMQDKQTCDPIGDYPVRQLGISHATITWSKPIRAVLFARDGSDAAPAPAAAPVPAAAAAPMPNVRGRRGAQPPVDMSRRAGVEREGDPGKGPGIPETGFVVEFVWRPTPLAQRKDVDPAAPAGVAAAPGATPEATAPVAGPVPAGGVPAAGDSPPAGTNPPQN